jgi:hypothetical protein
MLNEQTFMEGVELSTINSPGILYGYKFLISSSSNRFCQHPLYACVFCSIQHLHLPQWVSMCAGIPNFKVTMATDTRTDTSLPQCPQKCELVFKGGCNMAAMMHNVLPVAFVSMCGSGCTMQAVLCQTCSMKTCLSCQSDQPANIKFICQPWQSAVEMLEALQTVYGDNGLTLYSPHLALCHFWLLPRLKMRFLGHCPETLVDILCKANSQPAHLTKEGCP